MGKSTFCHICLKKHFRCGRIISVPPCTLHCCSACHCAYSCVFSSPASDGPFIVGWCPAAPSLAQPSRMIASVSGSMRMLFLPHHASPLLALSLLPTSPLFWTFSSLQPLPSFCHIRDGLYVLVLAVSTWLSCFLLSPSPLKVLLTDAVHLLAFLELVQHHHYEACRHVCVCVCVQHWFYLWHVGADMNPVVCTYSRGK